MTRYAMIQIDDCSSWLLIRSIGVDMEIIYTMLREKGMQFRLSERFLHWHTAQLEKKKNTSHDQIAHAIVEYLTENGWMPLDIGENNVSFRLSY